jgi:hypothetical protein
MKYSFVAALATAPQLAFSLVGINWSFPDIPSGALTDVTFGFNMAGASHKAEFYFAQQFAFENIHESGYCGIQNWPSKGNASVVHAVFSTFQKNTTSDDPNCKDGADFGPGMSCGVDFNGDYNATYNITVKNTGGTTWTGTVVNLSTRESVHIGTFTLPYPAGDIQTNHGGFVEYYNWNKGNWGKDKCEKLPLTGVTMFPPWSNTPGAGQSNLTMPYQYGPCAGRVNFRTDEAGSGYKIKVGRTAKEIADALGKPYNCAKTRAGARGSRRSRRKSAKSP